MLKEFNLDSLEDLKARLKPKDPEKPESPEEKEKRENIYRASLIKYAADNGVMKPEDFSTLESLKAKGNQDLVYDNWLTGWKEDNKEVLPEDADARAKEEFEAEYKPTTKRGLAKIEKEAKELRTPLEEKFNSVKTNYDGIREVEKLYPDFEKKVSSTVKEFVPEKFEVFKVTDKVGDADEDVSIEVEISAADRVEIFQKVAQDILKNESNFELFKKGDIKAIQALAKDQAETMIRNKYNKVAAQEIAREFLTRGTKRGSTTGAKEPFPLVGDGKKQDEKGAKTPAQEVIDSLKGVK